MYMDFRLMVLMLGSSTYGLPILWDKTSIANLQGDYYPSLPSIKQSHLNLNKRLSLDLIPSRLQERKLEKKDYIDTLLGPESAVSDIFDQTDDSFVIAGNLKSDGEVTQEELERAQQMIDSQSFTFGSPTYPSPKPPTAPPAEKPIPQVNNAHNRKANPSQPETAPPPEGESPEASPSNKPSGAPLSGVTDPQTTKPTPPPQNEPIWRQKQPSDDPQPYQQIQPAELFKVYHSDGTTCKIKHDSKSDPSADGRDGFNCSQ